MNIRKKIGLSMTMLAILVVIFVGLLSNLIARDTLKDRGKDFLTSILNRTSYDINLQINAMQKVTDFIYNDFIVTYNFKKGNSDSEYLDKYLSKFDSTIKLAAELSPSKSAYLVLIMDGEYHLISYRDYNNDGIPERDFEEDIYNRFVLEDLKTDQILWMNKQINSNEISSIKVVKENATIAIVGTDLNYYLLKSKLDTSKYLDSGLLFLAEKDGSIIYHPNKEIGSLVDLSSFDNEGMKAIELKNELNKSIVLARSILNNEWHLVISAETSDIFLGLSRLNYIIFVILIFASSLAVIYSVMVSKRIAAPYLYLTGIIEEIGKGNYDVSFSDSYLNLEDEIGLLTRAIRKTVNRQKDSFKEIIDYNLNLESIISERTKELVLTNNALEESVINTEKKQRILEETNKQLELSITEINETRKQLIKSEKVASSRYLAVGIAHNLNTPIGSAKSLASFIKSRTIHITDKLENGLLSKKNLSDFLNETKSGSEKILESIEESIKLIDKMKALSILKTIENISDVNIEDVIHLQVENSKIEHSSENCDYTILVDENLYFKCDLYNLQKIFYELIENSYTHAFSNINHPNITIKAYRNDVDKNSIIIEYFDNGIGIENELGNEIFTPLYTTKLSSRHGLGLTMVYNLVNERFNGEITVEAGKNKGLGFVIKLFEVSE